MKGIIDGVVRSPQLRHSRVGGNPERIEMTGSKSALISRLRGNDGIVKSFGFYESINYVLEKGSCETSRGTCPAVKSRKLKR